MNIKDERIPKRFKVDLKPVDWFMVIDPEGKEELYTWALCGENWMLTRWDEQGVTVIPDKHKFSSDEHPPTKKVPIHITNGIVKHNRIEPVNVELTVYDK